MAEDKEADMDKVLAGPYLGGWGWGRFPYPWALNSLSIGADAASGDPPRSVRNLFGK